MEIGKGERPYSTYARNPGAIDELFGTVSLTVAPVVLDVGEGGQREILAVSAGTSSWNAAAFDRSSGNSRLVLFRIDDTGMGEEGTGHTFEGAVTGLGAAGDQVCVILMKNGRSFLLTLSLVKGRV